MKILFVTQSLGIGGAETFNAGLLKYLSKKHQVRAVVNHPRFIDQLQKNEICVERLQTIIDIIGDWKGLVKAAVLWPLALGEYIYLAVRYRDYDVVIMTGFIEKIFFTPLAKIFDIKVLWIEFGPLDTVLAKFFGLPGLLYRLVLNLPDAVVEPTKNTQIHNHNEKRSQIIPCAIDVAPARKKPVKNSVICVSRLEKGKGQELLLAAWPEVLKKIPDAKLKIIGEGAEYNNLKFLISNFKLLRSVTLTGWVGDALAEIEKAWVCVFPSTWALEGFGMVMVEAMAKNRPLVAFAAGPAVEIVSPEVGELVPVGDIHKLASAIVHQLKHPASQGRKQYLKLYTWDQVGPQYEKVLAKIVGI